MSPNMCNAEMSMREEIKPRMAGLYIYPKSLAETPCL